MTVRQTLIICWRMPHCKLVWAIVVTMLAALNLVPGAQLGNSDDLDAKLWSEQPKRRISAVFEMLNESQPSAVIKAAAWASFQGKLFTASVCVGEPPPRLGCIPQSAQERETQASAVTQPVQNKALAIAARHIHGTWRGDDYQIKVDALRAIANVDRTLPLQWSRFAPRAVSGDAVVFAIGAGVYEAVIDEDIIILTSTEFRGKRTLARGQ